jgi:hypothetical protein
LDQEGRVVGQRVGNCAQYLGRYSIGHIVQHLVAISLEVGVHLLPVIGNLDIQLGQLGPEVCDKPLYVAHGCDAGEAGARDWVNRKARRNVGS